MEKNLAAPGEKVTGLVVADGDSDLFLNAVAGDHRIGFVSLRALDLPICRAQRWTIETDGSPVGWLAVAADGRTLVGGGGPGLPAIAATLPFDELPVDWSTTRVWPMKVSDRSTPGDR